MLFNMFIRSSVGADLSGPPPIYRPRWMFRYPDYFVKCHDQPLVDVRSPDEHVKKHCCAPVIVDCGRLFRPLGILQKGETYLWPV